jgi:hypothetical protein
MSARSSKVFFDINIAGKPSKNASIELKSTKLILCSGPSRVQAFQRDSAKDSGEFPRSLVSMLRNHNWK